MPGDLVLYIITCGGRPAGHLVPHVEQLRDDGWDTCVIATPSARKFICTARLQEVSGHVVRYEYKQPDEQDVLPPPDAVIVAPATFNTINKWAAGISDTVALGLLNEAVGLGLPIVAVPFPNIALARHPTFRASIETLRSWGIRLIFDPERHPLPTPNMGPPAADLFPWPALMDELAQVRRELVEAREPGAAFANVRADRTRGKSL
jgi:Flavoprotein